MNHKMNRRHFLKTSALAGGAVWALSHGPFISKLKAKTGPNTGTSPVGLATGSDHVDIVFQALQPLKKQISAAIGNRPVLIKPNCVSHGSTALADTPVQCLEGILEFLKSIGKTDVTVAENCPGGLTMTAFSLDGYFALLKKYPVRFKELSQEGSRPFLVWNSGMNAQVGTSSYRSATNPSDGVQVAKILLKPRKYFVISACRPKTHNYQVATLSYKNMGMGCALENQTIYTPGQSGWTDVKQHMHWVASESGSAAVYTSGCQDLCDTLYMLAKWLAPDMSVIDAYQGMEGSGPTGGTAVNQQLAIAGLDWLAVDRVAVEAMNIATGITNVLVNGQPSDPTAWTDSTKADSWPWPMYPAALNYCGQYLAQDGKTTLGQYNLNLIDVLGPSNSSFASIQNAIATQHANSANNGNNYYQLHPSIAEELVVGYGLRDPANPLINS
jgi:uncharacterized protein (DUF362 family)